MISGDIHLGSIFETGFTTRYSLTALEMGIQ